MEELETVEIPIPVLILAEIVWRYQGHSSNFVVTSLEGFRGLCEHHKRWVQHRAIARESVQNITMLCEPGERKIAIAALEQWPASDTNTYAIFDPEDLPDVRAFPPEPRSGDGVFPNPRNCIESGA